ncbi:hypothetical protein [Synechococcus sp. A15-24]|uniref:hypothetical protein n=1 Tax=Synechococcus sp. A15-24 TaxID=1050635 RepID=UPI001646C908|nr:hypothetical protein [Synechococcus sp. A15-24]QNJ29509.1 hypothetical protein SynA1524_01818 [Synechococcus sp. A15-24]
MAATTEQEFLGRIEWEKVHEWLNGEWRLTYEANQWMRFEFRKWAKALMPDPNAVSKWTEIRTNVDPKDITRYQFARAMELLHQGSTTGNDLFNQFRKGHDAQAVMTVVKEFTS